MADAAGAVVLFPSGPNEAGLAGNASGKNDDLGIASSFLPVTAVDLDCGNVSGASIRGRTRFGRTQKPPVARGWLLLPTVGAGMARGAAVMRWALSNSFKSAGVA